MITITIEGSADHIRQEVGRLLGLNTGPSKSQWEKLFQRSNEPPARTVAEDTDTIVTEGAGDVRDEITAEPEQPRRGRGRPRKNPPMIDGEATLVSEATAPAEPEQIDLEDVIAAKAGEAASETGTPFADTGASAESIETPTKSASPSDTVVASTSALPASEPADPDKGWTHDDAKNVARAMYVRLGTLQQHELDERLHKNLQAFGVQRIKDLALEQIEAFVRGVEGEVA